MQFPYKQPNLHAINVVGITDTYDTTVSSSAPPPPVTANHHSQDWKNPQTTIQKCMQYDVKSSPEKVEPNSGEPSTLRCTFPFVRHLHQFTNSWCFFPLTFSYILSYKSESLSNSEIDNIQNYWKTFLFWLIYEPNNFFLKIVSLSLCYWIWDRKQMNYPAGTTNNIPRWKAWAITQTMQPHSTIKIGPSAVHRNLNGI